MVRGQALRSQNAQLAQTSPTHFWRFLSEISKDKNKQILALFLGIEDEDTWRENHTVVKIQMWLSEMNMNVPWKYALMRIQ